MIIDMVVNSFGTNKKESFTYLLSFYYHPVTYKVLDKVDNIINREHWKEDKSKLNHEKNHQLVLGYPTIYVYLIILDKNMKRTHKISNILLCRC